MTKGQEVKQEDLLHRLETEVRARQDLQLELIESLRTQRALDKEIRLLRQILNSRSMPDFLAYKALRRADRYIGESPKKLARRSVNSVRRRAGAAKRRLLALRKDQA